MGDMRQLSLFDIIEPVTQKDIPYGYIKDIRIVGRELLSFQDLKNHIGEQIVKCSSNESNQHFRIYKVIDYFENCDTYYKRVRPLPPNSIGYGNIVNSFIHDVVGIKECMECYEPVFTCDRVALSGNGRNTADSWISEAYCVNGRFESLLDYSSDIISFFEIKKERTETE